MQRTKGLATFLPSIGAALFSSSGCVEMLPLLRNPYEDPKAVSLMICPQRDDVLFTQESPLYREIYDSSILGLGYFKLGMPYRPHLIDDCEFDIYHSITDDHDEILDIIDYNNTLFFRFIQNTLFSVAVREGWAGETDTGLKIGDSLEKFLRCYPNARKRTLVNFVDSSQADNLWVTGHLRINFDDGGRINMIEVSAYNHDLNNVNEPMFPIGPLGSYSLWD